MGKTRTFSTPIGPVRVRDPYYLASCDKCGWIGSSEECGVDWGGGDDTDIYCPTCHAPGADCGKLANDIERAALSPSSETAREGEGS